MRNVTPVGEYAIESGQRIRFQCEAPYPLPGTRVVVNLAKCYRVMVQVLKLEADGWVIGGLLGRQGNISGKWTAMSGCGSWRDTAMS